MSTCSEQAMHRGELKMAIEKPTGSCGHGDSTHWRLASRGLTSSFGSDPRDQGTRPRAAGDRAKPFLRGWSCRAYCALADATRTNFLSDSGSATSESLVSLSSIERAGCVLPLLRRVLLISSKRASSESDICPAACTVRAAADPCCSKITERPVACCHNAVSVLIR